LSTCVHIEDIKGQYAGAKMLPYCTYYMKSFKYMHSLIIEKFQLDFIENKFFITFLYLHEILNSVISW
jgi:hypothetical protein